MATFHSQTSGTDPTLRQFHPSLHSSSIRPGMKNYCEGQEACLQRQSTSCTNHQVLSTAGNVVDHSTFHVTNRQSAVNIQQGHKASPQILQYNASQADERSTLPPEYLRQRVIDLETVNSTQLDLITDLKIRVAVFENELQRSRQDNEAATNGLSAVIKALTRNPPLVFGETTICGTSNHNKRRELRTAQTSNTGGVRNSNEKVTQELEHEIEILRKTNRRLLHQSKQYNNEAKYRGRKRTCSASLSSERSCLSLIKKKSGDQILGISSSEPSLREDVKLTGYDPQFFSEPWGGKRPNNELCNDITSLGERVGLSFDPSFNLSTPRVVSTCDPDYGIRSLNDLIGLESADGFDEQVLEETKNIAKTAKDNIRGCESEDGIDLEILHETKRFTRIPRISVVQTGIDSNGAFQGGNYDLAVEDNPVRSFHVLGRRDYLSPHSLYQDNMGHSGDSFQPNRDHPFNSGIWSTWEQRYGAVELHQQVCDRNNYSPLFFIHDIQFIPKATSRNYLRTVLISNLPKLIELREVMSRVRGGKVANAILADTLTIAGSMSAFIVFKNDHSAASYAEFCASHPIQFPSSHLDGEGEFQTAKVTLVNTPTYPTEQRAPDRSRCLSISNFPKHLSISSIERTLACGNAYRAAALVEFWMDEYRTLHLEFSSITAAGSAFAVLTHRHSYKGLEVQFEKDSCAGKLDGLLGKVKPRRNMFPIGGFVDEVAEIKEKDDAELEERKTWDDIFGYQQQEHTSLVASNSGVLSLDGTTITGSSCTGEFIQEAELTHQSLDVKDSSSQSENSSSLPSELKKWKDLDIETRVTAIMMCDLNVEMANQNSSCWIDGNLPVGLAGSKHATLALAPGLSDTRSGSGSVNMGSSVDCSGHLKTHGKGNIEGLNCDVEDMDGASGVDEE